MSTKTATNLQPQTTVLTDYQLYMLRGELTLRGIEPGEHSKFASDVLKREVGDLAMLTPDEASKVWRAAERYNRF
jgi:hypothetical protein